MNSKISGSEGSVRSRVEQILIDNRKHFEDRRKTINESNKKGRKLFANANGEPELKVSNSVRVKGYLTTLICSCVRI